MLIDFEIEPFWKSKVAKEINSLKNQKVREHIWFEDYFSQSDIEKLIKGGKSMGKKSIYCGKHVCVFCELRTPDETPEINLKNNVCHGTDNE